MRIFSDTIMQKDILKSATKSKVDTIKEMVTSRHFEHWPICSIAYYALRNGLVSVSLSTWYKYVVNLRVNRTRIPKKTNYEAGIRANHPHEVWHADITIVRGTNGIKYYVYIMMDNFSRFILNYQVSEEVSAMTRLMSIQQAFEQYVKHSHQDVRLIVDGGVENNNGADDEFLLSDDVAIQKLIAGKDIRFSNSIVEAQNKIIKYRYLFRHNVKDIHQLTQLLDRSVSDYNYLRPHYSLKGLTPFESLTGIQLPREIWKQKMQIARTKRLEMNSKEPCDICPPNQ